MMEVIAESKTKVKIKCALSEPSKVDSECESKKVEPGEEEKTSDENDFN